MFRYISRDTVPVRRELIAIAPVEKQSCSTNKISINLLRLWPTVDRSSTFLTSLECRSCYVVTDNEESLTNASWASIMAIYSRVIAFPDALVGKRTGRAVLLTAIRTMKPRARGRVPAARFYRTINTCRCYASRNAPVDFDTCDTTRKNDAR